MGGNEQEHQWLHVPGCRLTLKHREEVPPGKESFTLIYLLKIDLKDIRKKKMISDDFLLFRDIIKKMET